MKRVFGLILAAAVSSTALAATDPRTLPTKLEPAWQTKTRNVFKQAIEIPSVHNRGETPKVAKLLADQFRAAGIPESDIHIMPYEALPGDQTAALIVRWRSPRAMKKPMRWCIMAVPLASPAKACPRAAQQCNMARTVRAVGSTRRRATSSSAIVVSPLPE